MIRTLVPVLLMCAAPVFAQQVENAQQGEIRVLDKITGNSTDLVMDAGETAQVNHLSITMGECRYPINNPSGDAFAELTIVYQDEETPVFSGWMLASAPALNAMEHPRYDVWVLRCITS